MTYWAGYQAACLWCPARYRFLQVGLNHLQRVPVRARSRCYAKPLERFVFCRTMWRVGPASGGLTFLHKRIPALVSKVARVAQVQTLWCFSVPFFS
ncbi:hypothetical protein HK27_00980 [Acetobacter orientalis]|nr:hypothetical protein HK27_00980 [Acetobacter orientalis]